MRARSLPVVAELPDTPLPDGRRVRAFALRGGGGVELEVIALGCTVTRLLAPDRHGRRADITLGYRSVAEYADDPFLLGAVVGRCANRIAGGHCVLAGGEVRLPLNNAPAGQPCHLHGGSGGFHRRLWDAEPVSRSDAAGVRFHRRSPDGEEGYPGNLDASVTHWLTAAGEWHVEYAAVSDQDTLFNPTHHAFFNLSGEGGGDIRDHELQIHATRFTPVTAGLIPTGELREVLGTPFDFTTPRRVGERLRDPDPQLEFGRGYDHNWVLRAAPGELAPAARLHDPRSGRVLEVLTTEPGLQLYTGNFLDGSRTGRDGHPLAVHSGLCLETQRFPDAPHHAHFPDIRLLAGSRRHALTVHRLSVQD